MKDQSALSASVTSRSWDILIKWPAARKDFEHSQRAPEWGLFCWDG